MILANLICISFQIKIKAEMKENVMEVLPGYMKLYKIFIKNKKMLFLSMVEISIKGLCGTQNSNGKLWQNLAIF